MDLVFRCVIDVVPMPRTVGRPLTAVQDVYELAVGRGVDDVGLMGLVDLALRIHLCQFPHLLPGWQPCWPGSASTFEAGN